MAFPKFNNINSEIDKTVQLGSNGIGPKESRVYISGSSSSVSLGGAGSTGTDSAYSNTSDDFTVATNAGAKTVTVTGLPYSITEEQLQNSSLIIDNQSISLDGASVAANVITVVTPDNFTGSETVTLTLSGPTKAYDTTLDTLLNVVQNPEWAHYTSISHIIDESNAAANTYFTSVDSEGYRNLAIQIDATDATGATFKIYGTLDDSATVPSAGGSAGVTWIELTSDVFGGAQSSTAIHSLGFIDTNQMLDRYLIEYTVQNATNTVDCWIRKY